MVDYGKLRDEPDQREGVHYVRFVCSPAGSVG